MKEDREDKKEIKTEINSAWAQADSEPRIASTKEEIADVYAPYSPKIIPASANKKDKRFVDAISESLRDSMQNMII